MGAEGPWAKRACWVRSRGVYLGYISSCSAHKSLAFCAAEVDIRGADLDSQYNVFVKKQDGITMQALKVESNVRAVANSVQSLGGVLVTVLTAWKVSDSAAFLQDPRVMLLLTSCYTTFLSLQPTAG